MFFRLLQSKSHQIYKTRFLHFEITDHSIAPQFLQKGLTYINGKWTPSKGQQDFMVRNPSTGGSVATVANCDIPDVIEAISAASEGFKIWRNLLPKERAFFLRKMFDLQMKYSNDLAKIITLECGKPLKEAVAEVNYGASYFEWFSEEARRIYGDVVPSPFKDKQLFFLKQPIGVAGIITPWNFPNAMITRKVAAALAAGCTCVIKPAEETPVSAMAIAQLAHEAGIPPGVINIISTARSKAADVGKFLCEHSKIATISFTGSTNVGKILLENSANSVKRVSLELGGNAPFIVFDSANLKCAVKGLMASKFRNAGQTCVCTNRILVQDGIYDAFVSELAKAMKEQLVVGDGFDPKVTVGPLINKQAIEKVEIHVTDAVSKGADLVLGGHAAEDVCPTGTFFEPTLLSNIKTNMQICSEEIFGPVAALMKFHTEEEAIEISNSVSTGLAGYFYSEDIAQIWRVANALEVGMVGANEGIISCAEAAFGGVKQSGIGREGSRYGIDEYIYIKYLCLGNLA